MKYKQLYKNYTLTDLRKLLSDLGGAPSNKRKDTLIEEIVLIQNGEIVPKRSNRGRPSLIDKLKTGYEKLEAAPTYTVTLHDHEIPFDYSENVQGSLDIHPDGYGFLRVKNYDYSTNDAFVAKQTIKEYNLHRGDMVLGKIENRRENKLPEIIKVNLVNGVSPSALSRPLFEELLPRFPNKRFVLSNSNNDLSMRMVDLLAPIGKGQRGLIVSPPKAGKTTLLKKLATSVEKNCPETKLIIVLIDERPEEVPDFCEAIYGDVVSSTFDMTAEHHIRVAELALSRAKAIAENGGDVLVLLDSITKLTRAYNSTVSSNGKTLSGGIDAQALCLAKKFFGAARNFDKGSLTIIATALVETGSRLDDVVFEEFKGTGNLELHLSRQLAERRIFPAINILKSGTRRDDLLLSKKELSVAEKLRRRFNEQTPEGVLQIFASYKTNAAMIEKINKEN